MGGRSVLNDEEDEFEKDEAGGPRNHAAGRDEDGDDEEEEEGQDEYEEDGFILDEDEEEEERVDGDEERRRKKNKKRRESEKNYVLDEDDYELLQDNNITAFNRPKHGSKFKRLKKLGRDSEVGEGSGLSYKHESGRSSKGGWSAEESLKRSLFGDDEVGPLEDIPEEEQVEEADEVDIIGDEDEMADFIVDDDDFDETGAVLRRKKSKPKARHAPGVSSSALQEAHDMFGDVDELLMLRKKQMACNADGLGVKKLEDEFEPSIISEKYMTEDDDEIRDTDIPERLQLSEFITGPPPTDAESIKEETDWIIKQLNSGIMSPLVGDDRAKEISKEDINNVLIMLHVQKFDIPFIAMYRKELCASILKEPELDVQDGEERTPKMRWHRVLWAVYSLDRKWLLLQKRKKALQMYYVKRCGEEAKRIDDETRLAMNRQLFKSIIEALKTAESEKEVDDADAKFNLYFPPAEVDVQDGQFRRPKRKSLYSSCYKAGLWDVASKFGLSAEQFGKVLELETLNAELEDRKETPEEVAVNFTCVMFATPQDVLKGARQMAAVEIGCEPKIKKHVRAIYMKNAIVSTSPTPEGNLTIDAYHQLAGVKWLQNKPLSMFEGAQWLLIQKAEEDRLLQVTVKLPDDVQKKMLSDAETHYLSEGVSKPAKLWNEQRKLILCDAFLSFILPSMEKEARSLLTMRAKNWLLVDYGKQLWNKVSVAPFHRKNAVADADDEYESRIMACCWGPGKPPPTMVMLDADGELIDVLFAGSICIRSQGVTKQQRKKNDQQRILKFMTDHQPHAVCVGAANLFCRTLKDDIYEVIFRIVEDHPTGVGGGIANFANLAMIFGDESLPRLYENSWLSSDQLPGQQGIVKRAVALGRYLQNPLAMVATLCGPGKEILSWKLCPLEYFLAPDEKYEVIEQVMVDATNQAGIDINLAASHEWLFAPLQFISGLGPRKASALQKAFVRAGSIFNRKQIPMGKFINKKVFINAAGFLRVCQSGAAACSSHVMDLLDDTRIHPESYAIAKNLAKDVYAEDASRDPNDVDDDTEEMAIRHVRERPDLLKALDIDEYAKCLFEQEGTQKRETLHVIKIELLHGFQDWRTPFRELNPEEEFNLLSNETNDTISDGRIVQVTVRNVQENRIICTFDSGLKGMILSEDYPDDGFDLEKIREGHMLTCKIKNINKNRFLVYLTCKVNDQRRRQYQNHNLDPYYSKGEINQRSKQDKAHQEELAKKHFKPRMIIHPHFQNLTAEQAMKCLSDKDPGESIIRPSSKGPSFLTLTLKVYDGVYAHKDIAEGGKDHNDIASLLRLGKTLKIDAESFEDLDEVMDRYVDPLVSHLKNMLDHRKFRRGSKSEVDGLLRAEKAEYPMKIVYCFGISHEHPGTFVLTYIRSSNMHHEYIGLYPKGFRFRRRDFDYVDHLVAFFQRNINQPPETGRTVVAMVPMKSPGTRGFSSDGNWGGSADTNNNWQGDTNSDRERSPSRIGGRFGGSGRGGHPSGLPRPGRGRGRGRGNSVGRHSDFGSAGCGSSSKDDGGRGSFPGAKVQNSPGREMFPGGWGSSGTGAGGWGGSNNSTGSGGGGWGSDGDTKGWDGTGGLWGGSGNSFINPEGRSGGWGGGITYGNQEGKNGAWDGGNASGNQERGGAWGGGNSFGNREGGGGWGGGNSIGNREGGGGWGGGNSIGNREGGGGWGGTNPSGNQGSGNGGWDGANPSGNQGEESGGWGGCAPAGGGGGGNTTANSGEWGAGAVAGGNSRGSGDWKGGSGGWGGDAQAGGSSGGNSGGDGNRGSWGVEAGSNRNGGDSGSCKGDWGAGNNGDAGHGNSSWGGDSGGRHTGSGAGARWDGGGNGSSWAGNGSQTSGSNHDGWGSRGGCDGRGSSWGGASGSFDTGSDSSAGSRWGGGRGSRGRSSWSGASGGQATYTDGGGGAWRGRGSYGGGRGGRRGGGGGRGSCSSWGGTSANDVGGGGGSRWCGAGGNDGSDSGWCSGGGSGSSWGGQATGATGATGGSAGWGNEGCGGSDLGGGSNGRATGGGAGGGAGSSWAGQATGATGGSAGWGNEGCGGSDLGGGSNGGATGCGGGGGGGGGAGSSWGGQATGATGGSAGWGNEGCDGSSCQATGSGGGGGGGGAGWSSWGGGGGSSWSGQATGGTGGTAGWGTDGDDSGAGGNGRGTSGWGSKGGGGGGGGGGSSWGDGSGSRATGNGGGGASGWGSEGGGVSGWDVADCSRATGGDGGSSARWGGAGGGSGCGGGGSQPTGGNDGSGGGSSWGEAYGSQATGNNGSRVQSTEGSSCRGPSWGVAGGNRSSGGSSTGGVGWDSGGGASSGGAGW